MLYIVGTPIGNLDDLSVRQAKTLAESEIILAEDTRSTGILLQRVAKIFGFTRNPKQKLISYYMEKEFEKLPGILRFLMEGKSICLISQSGMPAISDPGLLLIRAVIKEKMPFTVIPGPTAVVSALVLSGFNPDRFMFLGFLPKKESEILKMLDKFAKIKDVIPDLSFVFYESPHRIDKTLKIIAEKAPDAKVVVAREMTKKFEEIVRGTADELKQRTYKGEITVVFS